MIGDDFGIPFDEWAEFEAAWKRLEGKLRNLLYQEWKQWQAADTPRPQRSLDEIAAASLSATEPAPAFEPQDKNEKETETNRP